MLRKYGHTLTLVEYKFGILNEVKVMKQYDDPPPTEEIEKLTYDRELQPNGSTQHFDIWVVSS